MPILRRAIDFFTLGSEHPIRRLIAYYIVLALIVAGVLALFPASGELLFGSLALNIPNAPVVLQDGLGGIADSPLFQPDSITRLALSTTIALIATLALMLPVTWVYISARNVRGHSQALVQTLIILPIVVAGVVFVVRDSLALAFSLAGVVAAVRFRTNLRDTRDIVFIFLSIAVGFSAGVHMLGVGGLVTLVFNFVLLLTWRYDFGRNVLSPTASAQWTEPLQSLTGGKGNGAVPDRDLVLALSPSKANELATRFERVRAVLGKDKKKPRYNAVLSLTSTRVGEAQHVVEKVLQDMTKRWKLDEVASHPGKPDEVYYLVRLRKSLTTDELITAIRARAADLIVNVDLEVGEDERKELEKTA
ncbi:MAG TPA: DUF4956 domain-containing protein [Gemmatimonadaceae bacterium]|jgi:hypothetical protein